jgi:hypothetical protein
LQSKYGGSVFLALVATSILSVASTYGPLTYAYLEATKQWTSAADDDELVAGVEQRMSSGCAAGLSGASLFLLVYITNR